MAEANGSTWAEKSCKRCGASKPLSAFPKCAKAADGREGTCASCRASGRSDASRAAAAERVRLWKRNNPDRWREQKKAQSERRRRRAGMRPAAEIAAEAERRQADRERRRAERAARLAQERLDRIRERPWLDPRLTDAAAYRLRYRSDPSFADAERRRNYRRQTRAARHIAETLRKGLIGTIASPTTEAAIGYPFTVARQRFEQLFDEDMTWGAFAERKIHIDFIVPLAAFDFTKEGWQREVFALDNLQPLWVRDNYAKADRMPDGTLARRLDRPNQL